MIRANRRGQALVMLTLALFALCGIMGLAVDLGWSYYVQKAAQKAADAGALAAAQATLNGLGKSGTYDCTSLTCLGTPTPCGSIAAAYLDQACQVAATNGFSVAAPRQNVTIASGTGTPPTAPGVASFYWITVRATEQIPQLFSAIMGNGLATVSARATAVVVDSVTLGSLRLINREGDVMPPFGTGQPKTGADLLSNGGNTINALGGFLLASTCTGACGSGVMAAETGNNDAIYAPFTYFRGTGWYDNNPTWVEPPVNGWGDGPEFMDPTGGANGKNQPPLPAGFNNANGVRVPGGTLVGDCGSPAVVNASQLYAWDIVNNRPTMAPVTLSGCITFTGGAVFWGGVVLQGAQITFDEGTYVFAGAMPATPQRAGDAFSIQGSSEVVIRDTRAMGDTTRYGELFIFTDQYYRDQAGNSRLAPITPPELAADLQFQNLRQGRGGWQTGNPDKISMNLFGLDKDGTSLPSTLTDYEGFLVWMDRRNSYTRYNVDTGNIICGNEASTCQKTAAELTASGVYQDSTQLFFQATPDVHLTGAMYQPRGSWTTMQGGGGYIGPLQIITGALDLGGNNNITLLPFENPIRQRTVALVE